MMPERYRITGDSFGSDIPENWEEIADFLNEVIEKAWEESGLTEDYNGYDWFHDTVEEIWDKYCSGMLPDAPKAHYYWIDSNWKHGEVFEEKVALFDDDELIAQTTYEAINATEGDLDERFEQIDAWIKSVLGFVPDYHVD